MAVELESISFNDQFNIGATGVDYLLGNIGDEITCELVFNVKWDALGVGLIAESGAQSFLRTDFATVGGSWIRDGFKAGDDIEIANGSGGASNNGLFTIDTITAETITVLEAVTNQGVQTYDVFGLTPIQGIDYNFNLLENTVSGIAGNQTDLTDQDTAPRFTTPNVPATGATAVELIIQNNSHGWFTGDLPTIENLGLFDSGRTQRAKIVHTFKITPLFLPDWIQSIEDGVPPATIFRDLNSIKYFAKIDAKFNPSSPVVDHTSQFDLPSGNVGWYDEHFNGGTPNYTLKSVVYTDTVSGDILTEPNFNKTTDVDIRIESVTSSFTPPPPNPAHVVLNTIYAPVDIEQFSNTGADNYLDNYVFDQVFGEVGAVSNIDGIAFGTDRQTITDTTYTIISSTEIQITFTLDLSAAYQSKLGALDEFNRNGLIFVSIQDDAVSTTEGTDRNNVLIDFLKWQEKTIGPTLFQVDQQINFFSYPDTNCGGASSAALFSEDGGLARAIIKLKNSVGATITKFEARIEAVHDTKENFTLETKVFDLLGFELCNGIQEINITEIRDFVLPEGDPRNTISLTRLPGLDDGTFAYYQLTYGFKIRYETWRINQNVNADFCDNENQDWAVFSEAAGWTTQFNLYATMIDSDGNETTFLHTSDVQMKGYDTTFGTPITVSIQTFSEDGTVNLGGNVSFEENTKVLATFIGDFTQAPTATNAFYGILRFDAPDVGGIQLIDEASSQFVPADDSLWISPTGTTSGSRLIQIDDGKFTLESTIDLSKLDPTLVNYKLSARIGAFNDVASLLQEDDFELLLENGFCILLEPNS